METTPPPPAEPGAPTGGALAVRVVDDDTDRPLEGYAGLAWFCKDNGVVACFDALTGEEHYRERLGDGSTGFTPSPVAGHGKVCFTSEEGDVDVLAATPELEVLAHNELGEICMTTPAIVDGGLVFRTRNHVLRID